MTQPTLTDLHPNECTQGLRYYPFSDRSTGSCNSLQDLFNRLYFLNKTKDLNLSVFNMITGVNESKTYINMTYIMQM